MEKLAPRRTGAPNRHVVLAANLGFVDAAYQGGQHMRVQRIEVIAGTVKIGRHQANGVEAKFSTVRLTHLYTRNLGDCVPLIGRLQWPGEEIFLLDGLGAKFGIDAARAEEYELADP